MKDELKFERNDIKVVPLIWYGAWLMPNDGAFDEHPYYLVSVAKYLNRNCVGRTVKIAQFDYEHKCFVGSPNHDTRYPLNNVFPPKDGTYAEAWAYFPTEPSSPDEWEYEDEETD